MSRYLRGEPHIGRRFCIWLLAFTSPAREMASKLTSFLASGSIWPCAQTSAGTKVVYYPSNLRLYKLRMIRTFVQPKASLGLVKLFYIM